MAGGHVGERLVALAARVANQCSFCQSAPTRRVKGSRARSRTRMPNGFAAGGGAFRLCSFEIAIGTRY